MKRILSFVLIAVTIFALVSCSCFRSEEKYGYDDMTKYIRLPNFRAHKFEIKEDSIKQAIGTYLMQYASEYTVKRGDKINVDIKFYALKDPEVDIKGDEITELFMDDVWLNNVATPLADGGYQVSYQIENAILGSKIKSTVNKQFTMADDFFAEEYRGQKLFVDITVNNRECQLGDVLIASYKGYHIDENDAIVKEDGKEKIFDESDSTSFYIGSHLAIEDFEQGLIGMTVGVEKDIYATFPEDYEADKTLAGKKVLFKVTIKTFYTASTYDDAFVTKYFTSFKNTAEFEEGLRKEYLLSLIYEYISSNAKILSYPKAEYKAAANQLEAIEDTWVQSYGMTLDKYILTTYNMTRDEYIKSNMKTEMIFYALRNEIGSSVIPTKTELSKEKDGLISYYKDYYINNDKMTENAASTAALEFVNNLGESYIYEQVLYGKIDDVITDMVEFSTVAPEHTDYIFDAQVQ